mgnify:CR=1 FL=1
MGQETEMTYTPGNTETFTLANKKIVGGSKVFKQIRNDGAVTAGQYPELVDFQFKVIFVRKSK